jgi:hypothetical protein
MEFPPPGQSNGWIGTAPSIHDGFSRSGWNHSDQSVSVFAQSKGWSFFEPIQFQIYPAYLFKKVPGLRFIAGFLPESWHSIPRRKHSLSSRQHFLPPSGYKSRMNPKLTRQLIDRLLFTNGFQGNSCLEQCVVLSPALAHNKNHFRLGRNCLAVCPVFFGPLLPRRAAHGCARGHENYATGPDFVKSRAA